MLHDWQAETSLRAVLSLIRGRTVDQWQFADGVAADVLIFEPGNTLATALQRRAAEGHSRQKFLPITTSDAGDGFSLRYPFSTNASRLIRCLDIASAQLGEQPEATAGRPSGSLCQRLDDAMRTPDSVAVRLESDSRSGLLDLAHKRIHWPQPFSVDETALLLSEQITLTPLRNIDAVSITGGATIPVPWEAPLWAIGIAHSNGELLKRLNPAASYRMSRWPNFGVIGRRSADIRLTSLMTQRALTPVELTRLSRLPPTAAHSFINACALSGILVEVGGALAPMPAVAPKPPSRLSGMLGTLRRVLSLD